MGDAMVICLAVSETAAGVAVAAVVGGIVKRWSALYDSWPASVAEPRPPAAPVPIAARAGPAATQVFLL